MSSESDEEITAVQLEGTHAGAFTVRAGNTQNLEGLKGVITADTRKMFEASFTPLDNGNPGHHCHTRLHHKIWHNDKIEVHMAITEDGISFLGVRSNTFNFRSIPLGAGVEVRTFSIMK